MPDLLNLAINKTLSRTLLTSVTTLLGADLPGGVRRRGDSRLHLGPDLGAVLIGTYSSVALAVPLLLYMKLRREQITRRRPGGSGARDGRRQDRRPPRPVVPRPVGPRPVGPRLTAARNRRPERHEGTPTSRPPPGRGRHLIEGYGPRALHPGRPGAPRLAAGGRPRRRRPGRSRRPRRSPSRAWPSLLEQAPPYEVLLIGTRRQDDPVARGAAVGHPRAGAGAGRSWTPAPADAHLQPAANRGPAGPPPR